MKHPEPGDQKKCVTPPDYIRRNFLPSDRIAVLVRNPKRGATIQRISTAEKIAGSSVQDWMHYKNEQDGSDIYIGMNALKPGAFTRSKGDILLIRHLYVDLDRDGSASLGAIGKSTLVPPPNYVLNTSPDKYQVIWKVEGITLDEAEALLHALAREFDGDRAATDAARVLRLPGFMNKKYDQDYLVDVESETDGIYHLRDFRLETDPLKPGFREPRRSPRRPEASEPRHISQSERDWAFVKSALGRGADPEELITELADRRAADKSDPQYYARLTVTKALAEPGRSREPSGSFTVREDDGREVEH